MKSYILTEKLPMKAQAYQLEEHMGTLYDEDPEDAELSEVVREHGEVGDYLIFPEQGKPFFMKKDVFETVYKAAPFSNSYTWTPISSVFGDTSVSYPMSGVSISGTWSTK